MYNDIRFIMEEVKLFHFKRKSEPEPEPDPNPNDPTYNSL